MSEEKFCFIARKWLCDVFGSQAPPETTNSCVEMSSGMFSLRGRLALALALDFNNRRTSVTKAGPIDRASKMIFEFLIPKH